MASLKLFMMKSVLFITFLLFIYASAFSQNKPPNIIFIMADDVGAECLQCYGGESYRTPSLDNLANEGFLFTNAYTAPLCTPTRVQVLTGQYPFRNGWTGGIWEQPKNQQFLDPDIYTFARMLNQAGYATAVSGKWQLARFENHPNHLSQLGFDEHCMWTWKYDDPIPDDIESESGNRLARYWNPGIWQNGAILTNVKGKYGPDIYSDFLLNFMEKHQSEPFLLYYSMALSHFPFVRVPGEKEGKSRFQNFKDMIEYMDMLVGKFIKKTDELDISDNTIIIFTGDNGTDREMTSLFKGRELKGEKGLLTDAGTRVPFIVKWPGVAQQGTVCDALIDLTDMLPTFAEIAGIEIPDNYQLDGKSIVPLLRGNKKQTRDWIFCQVNNDWFYRTKNYRLHRNDSFYYLPDHYSPEKIYPGKSKKANKIYNQLRQQAKSEHLIP